MNPHWFATAVLTDIDFGTHLISHTPRFVEKWVSWSMKQRHQHPKKAGRGSILAVLSGRSKGPSEIWGLFPPSLLLQLIQHILPQNANTLVHHLSSFHTWHDIKLTELWLFDIQADNRTALLSNTWTIGKKCGFHKWVNLQLAVREINKPSPTKHHLSLKYVTCH